MGRRNRQVSREQREANYTLACQQLQTASAAYLDAYAKDWHDAWFGPAGRTLNEALQAAKREGRKLTKAIRRQQRREELVRARR